MKTHIVQSKTVSTVRERKVLRGEATRNVLKTLLKKDLDFHGNNGNYAPHNFHAFAAKFPPQIPRTFIENLTIEGEVVLDPMVGSGTAIAEALLLGRKAIGIDLDPLAIRMNEAKLCYFKNKSILPAVDRVLSRARALLEQDESLEEERERRFDPATIEFLDYWFLPTTQKELLALVLAIRKERDREVKQMLELLFSSIIVTKSGGVSLARDLAHSRPHKDLSKTPKDAIERFKKRASKIIKNLSTFAISVDDARVIRGDARDMNLSDNSIDLIVTSPPYANAIDYMRAHKFSLVWFGQPISELSKLRGRYIGSERIGQFSETKFPPKTAKIITQIAGKDIRKSKVLSKYYLDMRSTLKEMYRVLKPGKAAIIIVGTSTMRGINVQMHNCLAEIAAHEGFDVIGIAKRKLDRNRRMMPARFKGNGQSQIENRMHEEYVIGLIKSGTSSHA